MNLINDAAGKLNEPTMNDFVHENANEKANEINN